ncbi:MAG TPA: hypothetical protein VLK34_10085 [Nocardioidaceae bacterium]|nr:hypothetical protein [Nocardioidaceae bacterium]
MSPSDDRIEFGWDHRDDVSDGRVSYGAADGPRDTGDRPESRWHLDRDGELPGSGRRSWLDGLFHSRVTAAALAVVAVAGIGAAVVGRLPVASPAATSTAGSIDGLTADQHACLAFALVDRRAQLLIGARFPQGAGPRAQAMTDEVKALDRLATTNPAADYRLVSAFADVADQSVRMLGVRGRRALAAMAVARVTATRAAHDACVEIAGFDIDAVQPIANVSPQR